MRDGLAGPPRVRGAPVPRAIRCPGLKRELEWGRSTCVKLPPSPVGLELVVVAAVAASYAARSAPPEAPPTPEPNAQPSPEPQPPAPMADALAGPWGIVEPRFTRFRLPLPDAAAWRGGDEPP